MNDALIVSVLSVVPKHFASRVMGGIARTRLGAALNRFVIRRYCAQYGVNMDEFVGTIDDYATLGDFFIRPLKPGLRPVDVASEALVSPVDARVYAVGSLVGHRTPEGVEADFDARELTGSELYEDGDFAVLYLSPKDYHRIHYPREGRVVGYRYKPGSLWPVFPASVRKIRGLFAKNERLVVRLECQGLGELAVILVGAFGVGRMTASFCDLVTNTGGQAEDRSLDGVVAERGSELGRFHMGSTVILVAPKGTLAWQIAPDDVVRVGRRIAALR